MKRVHCFFLVFALLMLAALPQAAHAQVPAKISYQGLVLDQDQKILADGTYRITFRLYAEGDDSPALWSETQTLAVEGGVISTMIGAENDLDLPFDQPYRLSVQLEDQPESAPMPLSAAAYAFLARDVPDGTVVRSISGLQDAVEIVGGDGITVQMQDNRLVISSTEGGRLPVGEPGSQLITPIQKTYPTTQADDEAAVEDIVETLGAGGTNVGLDAAYDSGRIVTLDDGAIVLFGSGGGNGFVVRDSDLLIRDDGDSDPEFRFRVDSPERVWLMSVDAPTGTFQFFNKTTDVLPLQVTKDANDNLVKLDGSSLVMQNTSGVAKITLDTDESGDGRVTTQELAITGGADLSENFDVSGAFGVTEPLPGMVVSIDPAAPGKLAVSGTPYDRMVAGVVSGAGGIETGLIMGQDGSVADGAVPVALTGRVYVWVDAAFGAVAPGDLLTTSATAGHAMKVTDHVRSQGAILGKAMTALPEGRGLVLMLVTLQ